MAAPDSIQQLVKRFEDNHASYRSAKYNEAQLRQEFLNPFFEALGWDVYNRKGFGEAYKEVIHEASQDVEGESKAPDYAFRIGGMRKFFIEAKKPSVNIQYDIHPAFQLRRYAWSAKLPLSILTDFEEFAVYESRSKPDKSDSAATGRVLFLNYKDYLTRWDELAAIFSPEAIQKGSFDQYAEGLKGKRGTTEVDDAFLEEMEHWRDLLAHNLALRNPGLQNVHELNYAVQMTIDRIVFLRICEDRGIEREDQLQELLKGEGVYERLCQLFRQADNRYNSGLFHFSMEKSQSSNPDDLTLQLAIDDKVLKEIISNLYYPAPYVFREIPADILGQVYERFLGKVIRLTAGHQAKVEEKPEVRKAGGVYYTPTYIVDYIVKNTVGKLLDGKTPKEASSLKILDPACGSGSFLLGAYQYLLDWHISWYSKHEPETWAKTKIPAIFQAQGGGWRLTTAEKKRILLNNIHGVDIDPQAVEVTKLSLSLKVLEGESQESIGAQLGLFKERALPDLGKNIQCGNSLIGPDYYEGEMFPDEEERYRVNAFNWQAAFPQVFIAGGFDTVIGNPPYGVEFTNNDNEYLSNNYSTFVWRGESYLVFIEKAINLLRKGGIFSYILPDTYLNLKFTNSIRHFLLRNTKIKEIVVLPANIFLSAVVDTTLIFAEKIDQANQFQVSQVNVKVFDKKQNITSVENPNRKFTISTNIWESQGAFLVQSDPAEIQLILKITKEKKELSEYSLIFYGIKVYQIGKGKPPQTKQIRDSKPFTSEMAQKGFLPFFDGKHISRYELLWQKNNWLDYGPWLAEPRFPEKFEGEKILIRKIVSETLIATYIPETSYCNTLLYVVKLNSNVQFGYKYLLGLLNSHLFGWYFRKKFQISAEDTFPQILIRDIAQFPICEPDSASYVRMVSLVERMLALHKQSPRTPQEKEMIQRDIESTDGEIDALVYELYGLTEEEIKLVEGK